MQQAKKVQLWDRTLAESGDKARSSNHVTTWEGGWVGGAGGDVHCVSVLNKLMMISLLG